MERLVVVVVVEPSVRKVADNVTTSQEAYRVKALAKRLVSVAKNTACSHAEGLSVQFAAVARGRNPFCLGELCF